MKILIHSCCANCLAKTMHGLRAEFGSDLDATVYWYNPNIHPLIEYRRRLKALLIYLERDKLPSIIHDEYGLFEFCKSTADNQQPPLRCRLCYRQRLEKTASIARENDIEYYTSTLITSSHQSHELISQAGENAATKYGVNYYYKDLRKTEADEKLLKGLYRQQYCGCVFSEYERYKDTNKHQYKG